MTVYMDHAATTSTHPEVIRAMQPYFHDKFANPSGIYSIAKENRQKIEKCRQMIADTLHAKKNEIYFTAGGSEGDNWALKEIADTYSKRADISSRQSWSITESCIHANTSKGMDSRSHIWMWIYTDV